MLRGVGVVRQGLSVAPDTHVREHNGNQLVGVFDSYADIGEFARILHGFDGTLALWALPPGMDKKAAAAGHDREYIQAAQLFYSYYQTGDIPPGYVLRPEQGFTRDGGNVDLRDQAPRAQ